MSEPPIGVGVVGIGFGQQVHVPAFRADPRCRVIAIAASTEERARAVASKLGVPQAYGDWRQLIADPAVRIVSIAVPPAHQPAIAIAAAQAGKAIFCEKPSAATVADAQAMLDAADAANVPQAIDLLFPETPAWRRARTMLRQGAVGPVMHAALTWRVETYAVRHRLDNWKTRADAGGGALLNFASHALYNIEWLLGPIEAVTCRLAPRNATEARVDAWLELAGGVAVTLSIACDAFLGPGHRLEVYGSQGTLVIDNPTKDYIRGFTLLLGNRAAERLEPFTFPPPNADMDGRVSAMSPIAGRLVDAALGGAGPVSPGLREGLRVQQLIEAMRTSDRTGTRCGVEPA